MRNHYWKFPRITLLDKIFRYAVNLLTFPLKYHHSSRILIQYKHRMYLLDCRNSASDTSCNLVDGNLVVAPRSERTELRR